MPRLTLPSLLSYQLAIFTLLFPLFFLPIFRDYFMIPKTVLSMSIATLMSLTVVFFAIKQKRLEIRFNLFQFGVISIFATFLLTTLVQSPNQVDAWVSRGILLFSLTIIYLISSNYLHYQNWKLIEN